MREFDSFYKSASVKIRTCCQTEVFFSGYLRPYLDFLKYTIGAAICTGIIFQIIHCFRLLKLVSQ